MMSGKGKLINVIVVFVLIVSIGIAVAAEKPKDYPKRPIEVVVPYGAGGGSDLFARAACMMARRYMKSSLVIVNKPGAGGVVGFEYAQNQPADGYTILATSMSTMVTGGLVGMTKNQLADFTPVMRAQHDTLALEVLPGGKYNTIQDVITDAKARPGQQSWVQVGSATGLVAMALQQFIDAMGLDVKILSYNSAGKQHAALLGGHVDVIAEEPGPIAGLLEAGKMKMVVVFAKERLKAFPDVPTTKEIGANAFMGVYRGVAVKKGTPKPIVDYLHAIFKKSIESKFYKDYEKANYLDLRPGYLGPEDYKTFLEEEAAFFTKEYKRMGLYKIKK